MISDFFSHASRYLLIASFFILMTTSMPVSRGCAQTNCPGNIDNQWFGTVIYKIDPNITNPTQRASIVAAIAKWNTANQANGSGVVFQVAGAGDTVNLTFKNATGTGAAARFVNDIVNTSNGNIVQSTITFDSTATFSDGTPRTDVAASSYSDFVLKLALHEIGHTMGMAESLEPSGNACNQPDQNSVMNGQCGTNDLAGNMPNFITPCDQETVNTYYTSCEGGGPGGNGGNCGGGGAGCGAGGGGEGCGVIPQYCEIDGPPNCDDGVDNDNDMDTDYQDTECICPSPIVIDISGNGFDLTSAENGVRFDIAGVGRLPRLAWIQGDDALLALDSNSNGIIDNGKELFGNYTPQPDPPSGKGRNGFLALAVFDELINGGNGDEQIDHRDAVFSSLRLWQDTNYNGVSELYELHSLPEFGVAILELNYKDSRRTDEHGNRFRYRAKVKDAHGAQVGRWAWDVFLAK
jgi:hypothetical protein